MPLTDVIGRAYGPFILRAGSEKVDEYIAATGDDPSRWDGVAPPGFAAVALFTAAPSFFDDPAVQPSTKVLVHAEQRFTWHAPIERGGELSAAGVVDSVRERRGLNFVAFKVEAKSSAGPVLDSHSQFVMADVTETSLEEPEREEPGALVKGRDDVPPPADLPPVGQELTSLHKSASRADLVRYAGASLDWNPIHWDHEAAVTAGLGGVVVHGLLMAAWALQLGSAHASGPAPVAAARFRFRKLLPAATPTAVSGVRTADHGITVRVAADDEDRMTADLTLRAG